MLNMISVHVYVVSNWCDLFNDFLNYARNNSNIFLWVNMDVEALSFRYRIFTRTHNVAREISSMENLILEASKGIGLALMADWIILCRFLEGTWLSNS